MVFTSLLSRALRSTELRICEVQFDAAAESLLAADDGRVIRLVARRPRAETETDLDKADEVVRSCHGIGKDEQVIFFEVARSDASDFEETLRVTGERVGRHAMLRASSPVVANAIAALLIDLEKRTGHLPHCYFKWHEGNPIGNLFQFLFFGEGDVAPVAHEVLRRAVPDPKHRPVIHVS